MFNCWRYGNEDPFKLYHRLDSEYRPLRDPSRPAVRPRYPDRLRAFMYGCGKAAAIIDGKVKDTRPAARPAQKRERGVELPPGVEDPRKAV